MSYGRLTAAQRAALRPFVEGKVVHDLGAGDGEMSLALVDLGAAQVIAVEEMHRNPAFLGKGPRIRREVKRFKTYAATMPVFGVTIDVAFVSWPDNRVDEGLLALVNAARVVAYLGKNTDGTACGDPFFWASLTLRPVAAYEPDRSNTLIVYSEDVYSKARNLVPYYPLRGEEKAAFSRVKIMTYEEAEGLPPQEPLPPFAMPEEI
jgi:hypothetical protein